MNIRNLLLVLFLAPALALGGCAGGSATLQNDIALIESQAQADAQVLCGFIPTVGTIASLIPGFGTAVASAATIATSVCAAVANAPVVNPVTQSARLRTVGGPDTQWGTARLPSGAAVPVVGHYVR